MQGQQKVNITEQKPPKLIEYEEGFDVVCNDGTMKIALRKATIMDGGMESSFYSTTMWIKEEESGWTKVNEVQSYRSKEDFIKAISESEDFTEAVREYEFNHQNNNE